MKNYKQYILTKVIAVLCVCSFMAMSFAPAVSVKASETDKSWWQKFKDDWDKQVSQNQAMLFGAHATHVNNDGYFKGILLGSVLNQSAEFYNQPTKIFDYVNGMYKDNPSTSATNEPYHYSYQGFTDNSTNASNNNFVDSSGNDYSSTSHYQVFNDNSDYSTNNYSYNWYNPITNNYNNTTSFYYDNTSNSYYYQTTEDNYNYNNYVIDNGTYITYYIVQTDTNTGTEYEFIYDIYYELPDGRNSYDLTREEVWGQYFIYNIVPYDSVAEDDGKTLGLWHFDGNANDSSYWNNSSGIGSNIDYVESKFDNGKYFNGTLSSDLTLFLDNSDFDRTSPFTLEWIEFHGDNYKTIGRGNFGAYILPSYQYFEFVNYAGTYVHFALVYDGTGYSLFVNGVKMSLSSYKNRYSSEPNGAYYSYVNVSSVCGFDITNDYIKILSAPVQWGDYSLGGDTSYLYGRSHYNSVIDEMRLSKGALYSANYVPSAEPFTTNTVLVIPEDVEKGDIVIHSNYKVSDYRIGGAKPTYPSDNYVFVALDDNDVVTSVQQYQVNKWVEVAGRVYLGNDKTEDLIGYDMSEFKLVKPEEDSDSGDSDNSGDNSGDDSNSGFDFSAIGSGIVDLVNSIADVVGTALSAISDLLTSILDSLSVFTSFSSGFSSFLGQAFSFIPDEIWSVIGAGISLLFLVGIIKMLRG